MGLFDRGIIKDAQRLQKNATISSTVTIASDNNSVPIIHGKSPKFFVFHLNSGYDLPHIPFMLIYIKPYSGLKKKRPLRIFQTFIFSFLLNPDQYKNNAKLWLLLGSR